MSVQIGLNKDSMTSSSLTKSRQIWSSLLGQREWKKVYISLPSRLCCGHWRLTICDHRLPPLELFEHYEHGKDADPTLISLLKEGVNISDITGSIGAEVTGVQLSQLDNKGKDELALLVAQKKVCHRQLPKGAI